MLALYCFTKAAGTVQFTDGHFLSHDKFLDGDNTRSMPMRKRCTNTIKYVLFSQARYPANFAFG